MEYLTERISKMDIAKIYCSPLGRAKDTAKGTLEKTGMKAEICPWLEEFSAEIMRPEGVRGIPWDLKPQDWTHIPQMYDKDLWIETELMQSGDVLEKYNAVCEGIDKILYDFGYERQGNRYRVNRESNETAVLFCHFGVEAVILSHILNISPVLIWHGFVALPSSVTTVISEERDEKTAYFRMNAFGDISHLYKHNEEPSFMARFCECYSNEDERH
jgi:probable phosphoglycerate mutase